MPFLFALVAAAPPLPPPPVYTCPKTENPPVIDAIPDDPCWQRIPWSEPFQDIRGPGHPAPRYETRMKMLHDGSTLYITAKMEDPHLWATLTQRDAVVYFDNDFEVFIDPDGDGHNYFEIEVNPLGTVFDLFLQRPYRTRGAVLFQWDAPGVRHAIHLNGTLNNPSDTDTGWTVEFAIPQSALAFEFDKPLQTGTYWRINFSRVQWQHSITNGVYAKVPGKPEDNWVWAPQYEIAMHKPERWGYLYFSDAASPDPAPLPADSGGQAHLWPFFEKQLARKNANGAFFTTPEALGLPSARQPSPPGYPKALWQLSLEATENQFILRAVSDSTAWQLNHFGELKKETVK